ncbi:MAG: hypothetical protein ACTSWX_03815 [Promethearchaeota archaeon]
MTRNTIQKVNTGELYPKSSNLKLKDSIQENQSFFYQTHYMQTMSEELSSSEENGTENVHYYITNITQDIEFYSATNLLKIKETIDDDIYEYKITSTANTPLDPSLLYPFSNGGWQHNYPKNNSEITLNSQEITYLVNYLGQEVITTFHYKEINNLHYGNLIIATEMFTSSKSFQVKFGSG